MADLCCMVGCNSLGTKSCAVCGTASYCSVDCQKGDWKVHKRSCVNKNKLPMTLLSLSEVKKYTKKVNVQLNVLRSQGKIKEAITLMERCLAFVEHQYGVQVEGESYWRRGYGDIVENLLLINIRMDVAEFYYRVVDCDSALAHAIKTRQLLEHRDKSDESILLYLTKTERMISALHDNRRQFDVAAYHCEQSLMFARLMKGEDKIDSEYHALFLFGYLRQNESRGPEAIIRSEEAYILVSGAYGPVHPDVQEAATQLIQILIVNGDYSRADGYCRMNLENLTDLRNGFDQQCREIPQAMKQIADIWLRKPPVDDEEAAFALAEEAEEMIRKSCTYADMNDRYQVLGDVLLKRGKYTDETRMVLEPMLSIRRQQKSSLTHCLQRLVDFHDHMSGTMPPGDARGRERQLRDKYIKEVGSLSVSAISLKTCNNKQKLSRNNFSIFVDNGTI